MQHFREIKQKTGQQQQQLQVLLVAFFSYLGGAMCSTKQVASTPEFLRISSAISTHQLLQKLFKVQQPHSMPTPTPSSTACENTVGTRRSRNAERSDPRSKKVPRSKKDPRNKIQWIPQLKAVILNVRLDLRGVISAWDALQNSNKNKVILKRRAILACHIRYLPSIGVPTVYDELSSVASVVRGPKQFGHTRYGDVQGLGGCLLSCP